MITLTILAGVLAAAVAPPVAARAADSTWHPDADTAATEAFKRMGAENKVENAGGIVRRDDGQHSYTTTAGQSQHDHFAVRLQFAKGEHVAGLYHNHPGADEHAGYFSPEDIELSERLKVPSYIRFDDGTIRKYTPGVTKTETLGSSRFGLRVARGDALTPQAAPVTAAAPIADTNSATQETGT